MDHACNAGWPLHNGEAPTSVGASFRLGACQSRSAKVAAARSTPQQGAGRRRASSLASSTESISSTRSDIQLRAGLASSVHVLRAVQKVSQFCRIEKDSVSQSSEQSKIRRAATALRRACSGPPAPALPHAESARKGHFSDISRVTSDQVFSFHC